MNYSIGSGVVNKLRWAVLRRFQFSNRVKVANWIGWPTVRDGQVPLLKDVMTPEQRALFPSIIYRQYPLLEFLMKHKEGQRYSAGIPAIPKADRV